MMKPISNERVEWLRSRTTILDECIRISQSEMYAMNGGGAQREDLTHALRDFSSERIAIAIELRALQKFGVTP